MSNSATSSISPRLVFGLVIIALGTMFLLDNLGIVDFESAARWWPLAPIAVGLALALQPAGAGNRGFGWFLVIVGVWALGNELGIVDLDFWDVFPVFLIGSGGWLVWRALRDSGEAVPASDAAGRPRPGAVVSDEEMLSAFAFMGHAQKTSTTSSFRGGDLTAIMAGCTIDLRDADMGPEPAMIDVFAFWGGIEVVVPEDWVVTNKVLPLLGASEDLTRPAKGASKQLLVRGTALMGGFEIANEKADD